MKLLGFVTAVTAGAIAVFAIVFGVRSVPDIKRYLAIRSM